MPDLHALEDAVPHEELQDVAVPRERHATLCCSGGLTPVAGGGVAGGDEQVPRGAAVRAEAGRHEDDLPKRSRLLRRHLLHPVAWTHSGGGERVPCVDARRSRRRARTCAEGPCACTSGRRTAVHFAVGVGLGVRGAVPNVESSCSSGAWRPGAGVGASAAGAGASAGGAADGADGADGAGCSAGVEEKSCGVGVPVARSGTWARKPAGGGVRANALDMQTPAADVTAALASSKYGPCVAAEGAHVGSEWVHCRFSGGAPVAVGVGEATKGGDPEFSMSGVSSPEDGPELVPSRVPCSDAIIRPLIARVLDCAELLARIRHDTGSTLEALAAGAP